MSVIDVSNCLLNRLLRRKWTQTLKLRVTGLFAGNSPVTVEFLTQKTSHTENGSIWICIMYKLINFIKTSNHKRALIRASRDYTFEFATHIPVVNELFSAFYLYFHSLTLCHEAV